MILLITCVFLLSTCIDRCSAVLSLQQTVPPEGVAVCPRSAVVFTCTADNELRWRDLTQRFSSVPRYTTGFNQTQTTGAFRTELTDISGNTLTSTATIDSVSLNDDMRRIACIEVTPSLVTSQRDHVVQIQSSPSAPYNVSVAADVINTVSQAINLTWSIDNKLCVVVYHVEVTNSNTGIITNTNTTSQYIVLTLQTDVVYSFRVRGADSADRGEWSELFLFETTPAPPVQIPNFSLPTPPNGALIPVIVGAAVVAVFFLMLISCLLFTLIIIIVALMALLWGKKSKKNTDHLQHSADVSTRNPAYGILTNNEPVKVQSIENHYSTGDPEVSM